MKTNVTSPDKLESFDIYQLSRQLFEDFWKDSEILSNDCHPRLATGT
ncbi:MAG: hypothetical protein ACLQSR_11255 [Limisphaerales bacterium]